MNRILFCSSLSLGLCLADASAQEPTPAPAKTEAPVKTVEGQPVKVLPTQPVNGATQVTGATQGQDAGAVPQPPKIMPGQVFTHGGGNSWFKVTQTDLGTFFNHESAVGHFGFKNPKEEAVDWRSVSGSCQCAKAVIRVGERKYEYQSKPTPTIFRIDTVNGVEKQEKVTQINVGPGEEGDVEVHMEMHGITGVKTASLDIHTTDKDMPMAKLQWSATGAQLFLVNPPEVNFNQMTWNDKRDFTVTVTSPVQKDFNIVRMDEAGKDFTVAWEKSLVDGVATWTIRGNYAPQNAEGGGGGVLKFYSDLKGSPTFMVRCLATVKGPLEVKPGSFITLGLVRKGKTKVEKVTFEPNDGVNLDAKNLRFEKLSLDGKYVAAKSTKEGNNLVVEIEVSPEAPAGLVRGDLVVELNHPVVHEKRILFNGFVR
jgi:hypothetical protein